MRPEAPASYVCDDTAEDRPFGKRNAVAHLFGGIQTPFVMLRFIFGKAAWLTPRFYKQTALNRAL
jgi:predicted DCC family thiol-disulfide oxidoreductase YuxK